MSKFFGREFSRGGAAKRCGLPQRRLGLVESLEPRLALSTIVEDDNWQIQDGGMKDLKTGLVWSQDFTNWSYDFARNQIDNLVEGGYSDWRLPTKAEVQEAVSHGIANHAFIGPEHSHLLDVGVWSTEKCSANGGGHLRASVIDGSTECLGSNWVIDVVAVRGSRAVVAHDTANIRVFSEQVEVREGSAGQFTVALDTQPTANVTIPISNSDPSQASLSTSALVFTPSNWSIPQAVRISGIDDVVYDPGSACSIALEPAVSSDAAYGGQDAPDVSVTNLDNEQGIVVFSGSDPTLSDRIVSEDGTNTGFLKLRLDAQPKAGIVYVEVTSLDPTEGTTSPSTLEFNASNWNVLQEVAVTGVADAIPDGDQSFQLQVAFGAGSPPEWNRAPWSPSTFKSIDVDGLASTYSSGNVNQAIPDGGTMTSSLVVPQPTDGYDLIGDLNVTLNINHTYDKDLTATLISPGGQRVTLLSRHGSSGDNFTNTILDDEAATSITGGAAPFAGSFRPWQSLSVLDQTAVGGSWKLEINDAIRKEKGTLVNWSLNFRRVPAPMAASAAESDLALLLLMEEGTGRRR